MGALPWVVQCCYFKVQIALIFRRVWSEQSGSCLCMSSYGIVYRMVYMILYDVWFSMIWCMLSFGVWYGMVWSDIRYGMVYDIVWYGVV